jgi:hypothetical protein
MKGFFHAVAFISLAGAPFLSGAQNPEQEIHRALIQRDQQAAEFAARGDPATRARLEILHEQQRREPPLAPEFLPYQRQRMADERVLVFNPPISREKLPARDYEEPLPLPGGPRSGVDPVLPQGLPY